MPRRIVLAVVLVFVLSVTGVPPRTARPAAAVASTPALLPLHATHGPDARIADSDDRQVLLRGVNLSALGDYYLPNPAYPAPVPLKATDFPDIAAQGFDVVRLLVSWSALEPERGVIDQGYLARIRDAVAAAAANGLYVVIDMHQDAWGKYIASPPGTVCAPGTVLAKGWDGAPQWATIFDPGPDDQNTCTPGSREDSSAAQQAWDNFYTDTDGIMTELVGVWRVLGQAFAGDPAVAGYDLLNEPNVGTNPDADLVALGAYFDRAIGAIRAGEAAAGGFSHMAIFETTVVGTTVPQDFTTDDDIVFSGHNYGDSITPVPMDVVFDYFHFQAEQYGAPLWIGEYGWFDDPDGNLAKVRRYGGLEDEMVLGGAWWQWIQACGDPHSIATQGGTPPPELIHYKANRCPGDVDQGPVPQWQLVASRPYPRAAPGRIDALTSDPDTSAMTVDGTGRGRFDVWVPDRGRGAPAVGGSNIADVEVVAVDGGWRVLGAACDDYEVQVNGDPAVGGQCDLTTGTAPAGQSTPVTPRFTG